MSKQTDAMRLADKLEDVALNAYVIEPAVAELRRLEAVIQQLLEALDGLEKEFRRVYPIYYYAEPWGHETNVPLQVARAAIKAAKGGS
jgi:ABC-type phosphate transport system auxiliary subunit